jgi:prevent-host-death family protein
MDLDSGRAARYAVHMSDTKQTRIGIRDARATLSSVVRDVQEGRRDCVVITRGELPVAVLMPCTAEGLPVMPGNVRDAP